MKRVLGVLIGVALIAPAGAQASGARLNFSTHRSATRAVQPASVLFHVVTAGNVSASRLAAAESAIVQQVNTQVRPHWHTPTIGFGPTGIPVYIEPATRVAEVCAAEVVGCHPLDGSNASIHVVQIDETVQQDWNAVTDALSHEIIEEVTDPKQTAVSTAVGLLMPETCDPVEEDQYFVGNIIVSDFVYPRWFVSASLGPWDWTHSTTTALRTDGGGELPRF